MSENQPQLRDNYDLVAVLAAGLRDAQRAGETGKVKAVFATLAAAVHRLSLAIDPGTDYVATIVHRNSEPDAELVAQLLGR